MYTLRDILEKTKQTGIELAAKSGYSRATISYNSREIQDGITVRALREIAKAAGAELVIGFTMPDAKRYCECCGSMVFGESKDTN